MNRSPGFPEKKRVLLRGVFSVKLLLRVNAIPKEIGGDQEHIHPRTYA